MRNCKMIDVAPRRGAPDKIRDQLSAVTDLVKKQKVCPPCVHSLHWPSLFILSPGWLGYPVIWPGLGSLSTVTCWSAVAWCRAVTRTLAPSQDTFGPDWLTEPTLCSDWLTLAPSSPMCSPAQERHYLGFIIIQCFGEFKVSRLFIGH